MQQGYPPMSQNIPRQYMYQMSAPQNHQQPQQSPGLMMPPDLAVLSQQGYAAQQAQLAALSAGGKGSGQGQEQTHGTTPMGMPMGGVQGMRPQAGMGMQGVQGMGMMQQQLGGPPASKSHKKKPRPTPAQQTLPRYTSHLMPPHSTESYRQQAFAPPLQQSLPGHGAHGIPNPMEPEPWADGLDELDVREIAMARFRARQEILAEIFGGEMIKDIPLDERDPWEGLGMDGETLQAKVDTLEKENAELEARMESDIEGFKSRLQMIDQGRAMEVEVAAGV